MDTFWKVKGLNTEAIDNVKTEWLMFLYTVNSEIFARVLISRNFAYAKFHDNKTLAK